MLLFWKALIGLFVFDAALLGRRFVRLHCIVKAWPVAPKNPQHETVERVCEAVNYALIWYPKTVLCLQRATITACLLRGQGVHAQMALGAQKSPFKAHAWVEVDGRPINERNDVRAKYGVWERC